MKYYIYFTFLNIIDNNKLTLLCLVQGTQLNTIQISQKSRCCFKYLMVLIADKWLCSTFYRQRFYYDNYYPTLFTKAFLGKFIGKCICRYDRQFLVFLTKSIQVPFLNILCFMLADSLLRLRQTSELPSYCQAAREYSEFKIVLS